MAKFMNVWTDQLGPHEMQCLDCGDVVVGLAMMAMHRCVPRGDFFDSAELDATDDERKAARAEFDRAMGGEA